MSFAPGQNVGPYRIIEQLGQGGMATVFKAYHPALDRYVAIKVLHPAFKEDPNFLTRFQREARIVAKLDHPNIIPIHDFAQEGDIPYLVIRYVEGKTLKAVQRDGLLPRDQVLSIIRPVASALAYAHAQGVFHRDIKPSNIIIANDGHVYLADFGLARMAVAGESTLSQDMLIGTPQYISPEQAKGEAIDERSDIYSLGVVLFEMLTGKVPFSADTPYSIIHDHIYAPLPMPRAINPVLSPEVERVLLKALAKDPAARYENATELLTAFENADAQTSPALAAPPPPPVIAPTSLPTPSPVGKEGAGEIQPKRGGINRRVVAIVGAIVLLLVVVGGGLLILGRNNPTRARNVTPAAGPAVTVAADLLRDARTRVAANPNDGGAHLILADQLARAREYEGAFAEYDASIKSNSQLPNGYLHAGALAEKLDNLERAKKYYAAGVAAIPDNQELLLQLGDVYAAQKQWNDARQNYDRVLTLNANSAQAIWRMGDYYRAQAKPVEALREYNRALTIDPNLPEGHFGLGMLAVISNKPDEARRQFTLILTNQNASSEIKSKAEQQIRLLDSKK